MIVKKALEPLIASILLIVVVVILVTLVLSFGSDFTNKSLTKTDTLLDSSKEATSGLFYQNQVSGNYLQLTNLSKEDYNFTGYTILSTDYNSDYFWINSHRPFETNISFLSGSKALFPLLCMPSTKFKLELQDISGNKYTTDISPISNSGYTSCNQYHVPLWEFQTVSGEYTINTMYINYNQLLTGNNSKFETGKGNWGGTRGTSTWDETQKCLIFTPDTFNSAPIAANSPNFWTNLNYRNYNLKFKAKSSLNKNFGFYFAGDLQSVPSLNIIKIINNPFLKTDWQDYEFTFSHRSDLNHLYIGHNSSQVILGDVIYIDDVEITEIDPLPTITNGTKYLELTSTGILSIPSSQAYGTWEFDYSKGSDSGNSRFIFVANNVVYNVLNDVSGYSFYVSSSERLWFSNATNGSYQTLFSTKEVYLNHNVWYRMKITRTKTGSFTVYIKGGSFGDNWVLVSNAGGSGLNPVTDNTYTTSNYLLIDLVTGDRIANIKITPEIE